MAPHANFHQLISIEKLIVSVCRYHMSYLYADIICLISMQIYSLFFHNGIKYIKLKRSKMKETASYIQEAWKVTLTTAYSSIAHVLEGTF